MPRSRPRSRACATSSRRCGRSRPSTRSLRPRGGTVEVMATENHDSFFRRIDPFFSPRELRKIDLAYMLAKYAHRAQTRDERDEHGEPVRYFEHVRRATLVGLDEAKIV